jgi:formate dehydrogenase beta subunit
MELGEPDESGRPRPVPVEDSSFVMECDVIVPAIGQGIDLSFMEGTEELETTRWQSIVADPWTKQTRRPKLFVAGDCETGPDALVTACSGGRHAALNIDRLINEQPLEHEEGYFFDQFFTEFKVYDPEEEVKRVESKPRMQYGKLDPQSRKSVFDEVEEGFSAAQAVAEAERCLKCYQVATLAM